MGGSYGGYATLVGLTFTPEVFACGVDIVGPSNIVTLLNTIPPYWAPAIEMFKSRVGDHETRGRQEVPRRALAAHLASSKIKRPLLIAQGANDPRVKQSESDQIVQAMQEKKIPVTYVLFPDEGHGFARPENSLAFTAVTEAFLSHASSAAASSRSAKRSKAQASPSRPAPTRSRASKRRLKIASRRRNLPSQSQKLKKMLDQRSRIKVCVAYGRLRR